MLQSPRSRALALVCVFALLVGLFVLSGTADPDPENHAYPDGDDLAADYDAYVGDRADVSGPVVSTDPVTIETGPPGETITLEVEGVEEPVEEGQRLRAFGVVEPGGAFDAEETLVRDPWEITYMYVVSLLAGLWVLSRLLRGWRIDRAVLGLEPRDEPRPVRTLPRGERDG
ncbi:hypothetical protein [Natronorarus salvus]|uniref:hypothetical protein n=1 Tax=Natronorarus salvus TaxID=3117733 RepID=UPI002F263A9E